jgi:hypothetical protein
VTIISQRVTIISQRATAPLNSSLNNKANDFLSESKGKATVSIKKGRHTRKRLSLVKQLAILLSLIKKLDNQLAPTLTQMEIESI